MIIVFWLILFTCCSMNPETALTMIHALVVILTSVFCSACIIVVTHYFTKQPETCAVSTKLPLCHCHFHVSIFISTLSTLTRWEFDKVGGIYYLMYFEIILVPGPTHPGEKGPGHTYKLGPLCAELVY